MVVTSKKDYCARMKAIRVNDEYLPFSYCFDFDKIFTFSHLWKSYKNCKKGVNWKASTHKFTANALLLIFRLYVALHNGTFRSYGFYEFDIFERGKKRHIRSVKIEERVVQRCLCDYSLTPALSRHFIYDNGACLKGKGFDFSFNRLKCHLQKHYRKHGKEGYILLFDFSKFFDNISHEEIKSILSKEYRDKRITKLLFHFIDMFGDKGIGLGSQISQIIALTSANKLDHYIKEQLHVKYYGRYMDDGYLIGETKEELQYYLEKIKEKCDELHITLNTKKTRIVKLSHGFTFLKAKHSICDDGRIVREIARESVTRMRRKLTKLRKRLNYGLIEIEDIETAYVSWEGHAKRFNSYKTRESMKKKLDEIRSEHNEVLQSQTR